jgi:hypothetical protein
LPFCSAILLRPTCTPSVRADDDRDSGHRLDTGRLLGEALWKQGPGMPHDLLALLRRENKH